jgi:hypothetical protein
MTNDKTKQIRWNDRFQALLNEVRKSEADMPSSSEMLRRLTERAAAALHKRARK